MKMTEEEIYGLALKDKHAIEELEILDEIYSDVIDLDAIRKDPILKPLLEIKENYKSLGMVVGNNLIQYQDSIKKIDQLEKLNPKYSETIIMSELKNLIRSMNMIIQSQDLQRVSLKNAMKFMIEISGDQYILNEENEYKKLKDKIEKEYMKTFNQESSASNNIPLADKEDIKNEDPKKDTPIEYRLEKAQDKPSILIQDNPPILIPDKKESDVMDKLKEIAES